MSIKRNPHGQFIKGAKFPEEFKVLMKGRNAWNKGLHIHLGGGVKKGTPSPNRGKSLIANLGNKNPNWKGGISSSDKLERERFRGNMQKLILERDNYKCQICDSGGDLQVDHIASWAEFKELRFDPDNCRTLCAKCHYKITFGREMPKSVKTWGHNLGRGITK